MKKLDFKNLISACFFVLLISTPAQSSPIPIFSATPLFGGYGNGEPLPHIHSILAAAQALLTPYVLPTIPPVVLPHPGLAASVSSCSEISSGTDADVDTDSDESESDSTESSGKNARKRRRLNSSVASHESDSDASSSCICSSAASVSPSDAVMSITANAGESELAKSSSTDEDIDEAAQARKSSK